MYRLAAALLFLNQVASDINDNDVAFLNELPLDKLLKMKNSLKDLVQQHYDNVTEPPQVETFGAQALALKSPVKRGDYEDEGVKKHEHEHSKVSNIFSLAITTLAFLAFAGYLLCLIVQAVKSKQNYNQMAMVTQPTTVFLHNSGIKKRPQSQFASYGRRKRENREVVPDLPPEELFSALVGLCEGYAKWSER
ncbi:unnamed protein product [Plutella xylostella]|uniref:(diamondback moth) hypothetical protein n=1 Tax=Plutella xylostella TaxID=51655 RepID=A0A8S4DNW3_PLUXY|nr:unnamed protein product [Plutella xylostella]